MNPVIKVILPCFMLLAGMNTTSAACQNEAATASTPTLDFIENSNGTITHKKTGLVWKKCAEGMTTSTGGVCSGAATLHNWSQALTIADTSSFAFYTDWRVPNVKELFTIIEFQCFNPSINEEVFPAIPLELFWTSSYYATVAIRVIDFRNGAVMLGDPSQVHYVRLVRGGK